MDWYFKCPLCAKERRTDWGNVGELIRCGLCKKSRKVPGPSDQPDAYVGDHSWPIDMEREVFRIKGKDCIIDGCRDKEITLDHIKAHSKGGRTSVGNLQPMCKSHNSSKNDSDFYIWLRENRLKARQ